MDFVHPVEVVVGGAQGRLLAVLAKITAPLTLRRLARLAGVSPAQASRVMPRLVELGIVDRHEVPPASQFLLNRDNVAAQLLVSLSDARSMVLQRIGEVASDISPEPVSVIAFGSLARGEADADSDIDLVVVRPDDVDDDDERWADSIDLWRRQVRALTGNDVEIVESTGSEAGRKLRGRSELWRNIKRDGVVVYGRTVEELAAASKVEINASSRS
jgi:predicted nucleotidyltransferase